MVQNTALRAERSEKTVKHTKGKEKSREGTRGRQKKNFKKAGMRAI